MTRALTGAVYVAIIVAGICINSYTFMALSALLAALGVAEFTRITAPRKIQETVVDVIGGLILVAGMDCFFCSRGQCGSFPVESVFIALYLIWLIGRIVMQLYSHSDKPILELATSFMAQLYIALPIALMGIIYSMHGGAMILLAVFILIWVNDTGAYLVGSRIGKHRLFERLSPKKSWEGFFGGWILAIIAAAAMQCWFPAAFGNRCGGFMIGLGVIIPVFATWGDLAESMIKRSLHVKDSGHILPGHGGILDRIDSLLMAVPATVVYIALWLLF